MQKMLHHLIRYCKRQELKQLLQQQFDFGLKMSQIGDQYAMGAIRTGLQADQYVNNLTNQFFTNIARTLFAQQPAQQPRPPGGP